MATALESAPGGPSGLAKIRARSAAESRDGPYPDRLARACALGRKVRSLARSCERGVCVVHDPWHPTAPVKDSVRGRIANPQIWRIGSNTQLRPSGSG